MKKSVTPWCVVALVLLASQFVEAQEDDETIRKAVFKIHAIKRTVNLSRPWVRNDPAKVSGSGVYLGDGRILTNAHVVIYAGQISVQPHASSTRINARLVAMDPGIDLAVLEVDEGRLKGVEPPPLFETISKARSKVQVYGYPTGGDSLSVTEGIVSRVEFSRYKFGVSGLRVQVDAALNSGNSGGPALVDGEIVGLVYSRLRAADNIGYLIPASEIRLFLKDIEDGEASGKPTLGDQVQRLVNPALRRQLKLPADVTGLRVREPFSDAEDYPLKQDDVIVAIGDTSVDNAGMVRLSDEVRVPYHLLVATHSKDGRVPMTVLRNGAKQQIQVPVLQDRQRLLPYLRGKRPTFLIYGPIVFMAATADYLDAVELVSHSSSNPKQRLAAGAAIRRIAQKQSPLIKRRFERRKGDEQLIMVPTPMFPHRLGQGYASPYNQVLSSVNGVKVKNMRHLASTLRNLKDEFVSFEFAEEFVETLVFERKKILAATEEILVDNNVLRQCSQDLREAWGDGKSE